MDGPDLVANTEMAIDYCLRNPAWRLSIQTHKLVGVR
jgi:organic radical activating enzyme